MRRSYDSPVAKTKKQNEENCHPKQASIKVNEIRLGRDLENKASPPHKMFFNDLNKSQKKMVSSAVQGYLFKRSPAMANLASNSYRKPEPISHDYSPLRQDRDSRKPVLNDLFSSAISHKRELSQDSLKKSASLNRQKYSCQEKRGGSPIKSFMDRLMNEKHAKVKVNKSLSKFLTTEEFSCTSRSRLAKSQEQKTLEDQLKYFVSTNPAYLQQSLRRNIEEKLRKEPTKTDTIDKRKISQAHPMVRKPFWSGQKKTPVDMSSAVKHFRPEVRVTAFGDDISLISNNAVKNGPREPFNRSISLLRELGSLSIESPEKHQSDQLPDTRLNTYSFCIDNR